jgi:hypothetical protein
MKRKPFALALALAAAIALVVVPLALAAGNDDCNAAKPHAKGKPFLAKGTVVSVDPAAGTLVVTVAKGSHSMKPYFGTDVTFTLAAGSHISARTIRHHGKVHFKHTTLDNVTPGSKANINGRLGLDPNAPVFFARHIVVKLAPASSPSPTPSPTESASLSAAPAF